MIISYVNNLDDWVLAGSYVNLDYPIKNIKNVHLSKVWRSNSVDEAFIIGDCLTTYSPNSIRLAGTNITSTGTAYIQANNTNIWNDPSVNIELLKEGDVYYIDKELGDYRFWRILINDSDNTDGFISVGRVSIGKSIEIQGPHITFQEIRNNTTEVSISQSGQAFGDFGYIYRNWEMSFPYWNNEEKTLIEEFADTVQKSIPFFATFADDNGCKLGPVYCIMDNDMTFTHLSNLNIWSSTINFVEVF